MVWAEARRRPDAGTTITEVLVTLAVAGLVAVTLFGVMIGSSRVERRSDLEDTSEAELRFVAQRVTAEVREASGLGEERQARFYRTRLPLLIAEPGGDPVTSVRWRVDAGELVREVLDDLGGVIERNVVLGGLADDGITVFAYHHESGRLLDPDADAVDSFASCAARVTVHLAIERRGDVFSLDAVASPRGRALVASAC